MVFKVAMGSRNQAKGKYTMKSEAAQAAAAIRKELKALFPKEKMSVTSDNYAGGNAVRVAIGNRLPTRECGFMVDKNTPEYAMRRKVEAVTDKYTKGHFDGMTDSYDYSNRRDDIPQVKYITVGAYHG